MAEEEGGVVFVNTIGSDIMLWKKSPGDDYYVHTTCLLYDDPEYHLYKRSEIGTSWKFFCHVTKRYLLANGKKTFHHQKYESPKIKVNITFPLYTLKELCTFTIATRILATRKAPAINDLEIPKVIKADIINTANHLMEVYKNDPYIVFDWTVYHEEDY